MSGEKLRALIDKYIDGDLTQEDRDELNSFLDNSPEHARTFWKEIRQHWLTRDILLKNEGVVLAKKEDEFVSEARYIKTKTHSERRSRKKAFPLIWTSLAACIMLVIGVYIFNFWQASRTDELIRAEFTEIRGDVKLIRNGTEYRVEKGMDISTGDSVHTGPSGSTEYRYKNEDTVISLSDSTSVKIYQENQAKRMFVSRGTVTCDIAPQLSGRNMQLNTPDMTVNVKGTNFSMNVNRRKSSVNVMKGSVEVSSPSVGKELVRSGEYLAVQPGLVIGPVPSHGSAEGNPDYTGRVICEGKGAWRIKQSPKGLLVTQNDSESVETGIIFDKPRLAKGSIACEVKVISARKTDKKEHHDDRPCFVFFWLFLDGKPVQNLVPQTNLKLWDPLKALKKGEWYKVRVMFEVKQSKDKGRYLHITWSNFTDRSGRQVAATVEKKRRQDIYGSFEGLGSIGIGTSGLAAEWRNIKIKSIE